MTNKHTNYAYFDPDTGQLICQGNWNVMHLTHLTPLFDKMTLPKSGEIIINGDAIDHLDSAGAWLIIKLQKKLEERGATVQFKSFSDIKVKLLDLIRERVSEAEILPTTTSLSFLTKVGKNTWRQLKEFNSYLAFVGHLNIEMLRQFSQRKYFRWTSIIGDIYKNGYQALAIIALLSFMIGVVMAYQMGLQLRNYGADIFIVDLLGLSILREFAPLLTAIMVAGRTGSAFTAQLGMMKINQELDALNIMGITPAELLILPRIIALFIALPLLTMWADIFGMLGGIIMSSTMLHITWADFMDRFPRVIPLRALLIGLGKAPVFALIIASIGCFQGVQVHGDADSVGRNTTRSVVLAIFFIIVADAIFSIIFSRLKL